MKTVNSKLDLNAVPAAIANAVAAAIPPPPPPPPPQVPPAAGPFVRTPLRSGVNNVIDLVGYQTSQFRQHGGNLEFA